MKPGQGIAFIDILRWGQSYIACNGEDISLKERIEKATLNMIDIYISIATEGIKRAIKEGMEEAILYDDFKEIRRLHHLKEITHEQYENNPIKKASNEYAGAIKFRVADLTLSCILAAITTGDKIPTYKNALNEAINQAEKHITTICNETQCNAEIATHITKELINRVCMMAYDIYHQAEYEELQKSTEEYSHGANEAVKLVTQPYTDPKNDKHYKKRDEIEKKYSDFIQSYMLNVYKYDQVDNITKNIVKKIFQKPKLNAMTLKSILPNNYTIPNNKLSNEMPKDLLGIGEIALTVCKGKKEVLTTVSVDYDSEGIQIYNKSERFTPYDRVVHNAVCSLYETGNEYVTPVMVYRCMNGLTNQEYISPQAVGAVTKSLDKVSRIRCRIDWTAEAQARGISIDSGLLEGNILATKKIIVTAGGKTMEAYQLLDKPILYTYAQTTKQVITIPIKLLQTKEAIRSTDDVIVIREYLIRRIEIMKNSNKQSNKILYESIYKEMGLVEPTKEKAKKIREAAKSILTYWENEEYIKSFKEYKEGRTFKGIEIIY